MGPEAWGLGPLHFHTPDLLTGSVTKGVPQLGPTRSGPLSQPSGPLPVPADVAVCNSPPGTRTLRGETGLLSLRACRAQTSKPYQETRVCLWRWVAIP